MQDASVTYDLPPLPPSAEGPQIAEPAPRVNTTLPYTPPPPIGMPPPPQYTPGYQAPVMQPAPQQIYQPYVDPSTDPRFQPKPGDEKLFLVFYKRSVQDWPRTHKEQRPCFHEVDYVRIHIPGDKNNVQDLRVTPELASRFRDRYGAWQRTQTNEQIEGFPLKEWTQITRSQVDELKHFHVHTVEQLAGMPDNLGSRFMGFFDLRNKARAYLSAATSPEKLAKENESLKQQMVAMAERLQAIEDERSAAKEPSNVDNAHRGGGSRGR